MISKFSRTANTILIGAIGSLLASGVIWLIGQATGIQFLRLNVPLWFLVIIVFFLLTALFYAFYRVHGIKIVMTFSAFRGKQWYADLLRHILIDFAHYDIDVIVKIPRRDYSPTEQVNRLDDIVTHRHRYTAAIVVPIEPHETRHEIIQFTKSFAKPVLFLDVQPFDSEDDYPPGTAYLGYDNEAGGTAAAESMSQFLQWARIEQPRILIIEANAQTGRQTGFEKRFKELMPNAIVIRHDEGNFARSDAKKIAQNYLEASGRSWPFQGVYCTNDEMALGVNEALLTLPKEQRDSMIIIGYDGIGEARLSIDRGDTMLRNTVIQNTRGLAEQTVRTLLSLIDKKETGRVINKLSPLLYKRMH